jgi:hypothetical protein
LATKLLIHKNKIPTSNDLFTYDKYPISSHVPVQNQIFAIDQLDKINISLCHLLLAQILIWTLLYFHPDLSGLCGLFFVFFCVSQQKGIDFFIFEKEMKNNKKCIYYIYAKHFILFNIIKKKKVGVHFYGDKYFLSGDT